MAMEKLEHQPLTDEGYAPGAQTNLFSLPVDIRHRIYQQVVAVPHPLYIFQDSPGHKLGLFAPDRPCRWLALLYATRCFRTEASPLVYSSNHFAFMDTNRHQADLLQAFLDGIGRANASHLCHVTINFPVTETHGDQLLQYRIQQDDLRSLQLLQDRCKRLQILELFVQKSNAHNFRDANRAALSHINTQLKAISSVPKIIVKSYTELPISEIAEVAQHLGWVLLRG